QGGFYSSVDSETDAEEGKYYVWKYSEVMEVLGEDAGKTFAEVYGIDPEGNFHEESSGEPSPNNILHLRQSIHQLAHERGIPADEFDAEIHAFREQLLASRSLREYPHLDDKVIAAWNGIMIEGLAYAGRKLKEPKYVRAAKRAADFVLETMVKEGRLQRTSRGKQAKLSGYLNDHAFMAMGLIELHRSIDLLEVEAPAKNSAPAADQPYLDAAVRLADVMLDEFQDPISGGFFFTADPTKAELEDDQKAGFVIRSKNLAGGGNMPSGNGVAARVLLDLAELKSERRYRKAAKKTLLAMSGHLDQYAGNPDHLLIALTRLGTSDSDRFFSGTVVDGRQVPPLAKSGPGRSLRVKIQLIIEEGWHIYAAKGLPESLAPIRIEVLGHPAVRFATVEPPPSVERLDPALKQDLGIYEGEISFDILLELKADVPPGEQTIPAILSYQACDDSKCIAPESIPFNLSVVIE
ncbi:MAG: protein-disulfide reductase DsbD domain-containing protein, partial [Planctomycetota bacterium]